tara:strand:+ start:30421 stop:30870 length:450 start_codon:yes stop_codon:yes gene_type:complete
MILVSEDPINAADQLAIFEKSVPDAGGIVSFSGQVRPKADGESVTGLHLQAYHPMTTTGIEEAVQKAQSRWPLNGIRVLHRVGTILTGETIVFVATASEHRRAAFEAADFLMDYLKTDAIFWKKELTENGEKWVEPRAQDYDDSARWIK